MTAVKSKADIATKTVIYYNQYHVSQPRYIEAGFQNTVVAVGPMPPVAVKTNAKTIIYLSVGTVNLLGFCPSGG